jgi:Holliday junction DNA helicase RuvA
MIGKLRGIVDSYGEDWVILDVQGVGYVVFCSSRTLSALPSTGQAAMLAIETYVREDQIRLFGFTSDEERDWFRLLQTVQGIGTRVALAILSTFKPGDLASAIALGAKRAPGTVSDAVSALVNLGYGQTQASAAVAAALREAGEGAETARLIRLGLRELSR